MARANGLDFFAITEHNHRAADGKGPRKDNLLISTQPDLYAGQSTSLVESANRNSIPGQFVTIYGQEVSTISQGNHINIFDVRSVVDDNSVSNGDVPALLNWMRTHTDSSGQPALLQFNHPRDPDRNLKDYGRDDFPPTEWVTTLDPFVELIEVLNAPALKDGEGFRAHAKEGYYLEYLNLGFHIGPSVGHDNHWKNWGSSTDARVGVIATALTRESIITALRARRTFASDDKNLKVIFRSGEAIGGDIVGVPGPGTTLPLTVEISDSDEPNARYRIDVLADHPGGDRARRPVESFRVEGNTPGRFPLEGVLFDGPGQFVLLRITQTSPEDGDEEHEETEDRVWTAPIWFQSSAPAALATAAIHIVDLLANPAGEEAVNEGVRLRNLGSTAIDLSGWQLRDLAGNVWILTGSAAAGQTVTIMRNAGMGSLYRSKHEFVLILKKGNASHVNNVQLGVHGRYRTNVWDFAGVNSFGSNRMEDLEAHPTVKPVALVAEAIRDVTHRGDIVLDAFMGSGTTILACERTGRIAYGMEIALSTCCRSCAGTIIIVICEGVGPSRPSSPLSHLSSPMTG